VKKPSNEVILCCPSVPWNPCCPSLKINEEKSKFTITDDYDKTITIDNKDIPKLINDINRITSMHIPNVDNQG